MFGTAHILYLIISFILTATILVLFKVFVKEEKNQNIIIKIMAGIQLGLVILSRWSLLKYMTPGANPLPYSLCTIIATVLSITVLITPRNSFAINGLTFLSVLAGLLPTIYASYIDTQGNGYLFYPCTIISLLDHSWLLLFSLMMLISHYVRLADGKCGSCLFGFGLISLYSVMYIHFTGSYDVASINSNIIKDISSDLFTIFIGTFILYMISVVIAVFCKINHYYRYGKYEE